MNKFMVFLCVPMLGMFSQHLTEFVKVIISDLDQQVDKIKNYCLERFFYACHNCYYN